MKRRRGKVRVGVVGVGRGGSFARGAEGAGMKLVALCDTWEEKLLKVGEQLGVATYTDFEKFLEHDMDAVILANYFHQHAPLAIKALRAGKHVMSETAACHTLAEGVQLVREVEKSGQIYMFAENYPYSLFNQEMRRLYQAGKVGEFMYGEGEYVHPMSADTRNALAPGIDHWRNWLPATYYSTHALAPIMFITDTMPVKVNGFVIEYRKDDPVTPLTVRRGDSASCIICRMDNGGVAKLLQVFLRGHGTWVRIHGSKGLMENLRYGERRMVRLVREQWHEKKNGPEEQIYMPEFPKYHAKAVKSGHGGGDFFMDYHFSLAIKKGEQPYLDVYRGVTMSVVGPLAYRSALDDSAPVEVPDFRKESTLRRYANDHWSPDPARRKKGQPWPSVRGDVKPTRKGLAYARKVWSRMGYNGR
jgi:predicted dehydrogenase